MKTVLTAALIAVCVFGSACSNQNSSNSSQDVNIYLVSIGSTNQHGKLLECNDLLVEVSKSVKVEKSPLEATIAELLETKDTEEFKNYVKGIQVLLSQVTIAGGVADVYLNGELTISNKCDIIRIREQLNETAKQFSDLKKVNFYINTQPLEKYLDLAGQGFK